MVIKMQDKQELIREKLNLIIKTQGIRANFISQQIGVHPSLISRFRKGKELWNETLELLEKFLENK